MYATSPIFYYSYTVWVVVSRKGTLHIERGKLREAEWLANSARSGETQVRPSLVVSVGPPLFPLQHSSVFLILRLPPAHGAPFPCLQEGKAGHGESIKCHGNLTRSRTSGSCQIPCPLLGCSLIEDEQKPKAGKCLPESILICPPHSTPFLQLLLEPALPKACCGTGVCCSG